MESGCKNKGIRAICAIESSYLAAMLRFETLALTHFKNYTNRAFEFHEKVVGICGKNGVGKTNLLDAIHYICFTKSYFTRSDMQNVQQGKQGFRVEAGVHLSGKSERAACVLRENGKKEFLVNENLYERFASHIGRYPCVIVAPDDIQMITGASDERRRLIDALLSQIDPDYLSSLITYNRLVLQRNSLLKGFAEKGQRDLQLLDVIDEQLIKPSSYIVEKRRGFLLTFLPEVKKMYVSISGQYEDVTLLYHSDLLIATIEELLKASRQRDLQACRTTSGIHRDDLLFMLDNMPFRNIASQGQRKSLLFALKLTEMEVLRNNKGFAPVLLLDDVFEKLDSERISSLLQKVCEENDGHVFITDTSAERLKMHLERIGVKHQIILL